MTDGSRYRRDGRAGRRPFHGAVAVRRDTGVSPVRGARGDRTISNCRSSPRESPAGAGHPCHPGGPLRPDEKRSKSPGCSCPVIRRYWRGISRSCASQRLVNDNPDPLCPEASGTCRDQTSNDNSYWVNRREDGRNRVASCRCDVAFTLRRPHTSNRRRRSSPRSSS